MELLGEIAIIAGAFAAIGIALDKVVLRRHDIALKRWLTSFWVALHDIRPKKLPRSTAAAYLRFVHRTIGPDIRSWRFIATSIAISLVMTTAFFFLGKAIRNSILQSIDPEFGSFFEHLPGYAEMYWLHLDKAFVYPINALFDILTIILTTFLVSQFFLSRTLVRASRFIVLDLMLCAALFYVCLYIIVSNDIAVAPQGGLFSFHEHIAMHMQEPAMFAHWLSSGMTYSATVFYPTLMYLLIFLLLVLAAIFIRVTKSIGLFYAESVVDNEKSVFFVTGTFIGIVAALAKAASQLMT